MTFKYIFCVCLLYVEAHNKSNIISANKCLNKLIFVSNLHVASTFLRILCKRWAKLWANVCKNMCNFLVTESRNLSSLGHFSQSTEIKIDTMSVLFILLSARASGELTKAETRSWGEEQEHSGAEVLVCPTQWSVLVLGTASPHIHCDKSQNSLTMTLSTLSYWNFLF